MPPAGSRSKPRSPPGSAQKIRLRFVTSSDYRQPASDIFLDNIGIGEPRAGSAGPGHPV